MRFRQHITAQVTQAMREPNRHWEEAAPGSDLIFGFQRRQEAIKCRGGCAGVREAAPGSGLIFGFQRWQEAIKCVRSLCLSGQRSAPERRRNCRTSKARSPCGRGRGCARVRFDLRFSTRSQVGAGSKVSDTNGVVHGNLLDF